ncbi:MAG: hypothetical protein CSA39_03365 [Flavobacteriales bacterium]|nr:MAG: hypothetical protein CSA39_03365 [Flavobacteriales bacterium]
MKKIILSGVLILFVLMAFAQEKAQQERRGKQFTAEQRATLLTKKMQLHLDLSSDQYKKLLTVNTDFLNKKQMAMENRESDGREISKEGKFDMLNAKMDARIAYQNEVKKILNEEQFEKYLKMPKDIEMRHKKCNHRKHHRMGRRHW